MKGFKVTTHDLRPPIQGGNPIWSGEVPFTLPRVDCDMGDAECSRGWNFCLDAATALRVSGLWPNGRPSRLWLVEANGEAIQRGDKCRSPILHVGSEASDADINQAIQGFSRIF